MSRAWAETGNPELARRCAGLAKRLENGIRRAVASSQRRLGDGSLFIPARLLDREPAYASLTQARLGSYWNLVMPYALASGIFAPESPEADGALTYMLRHGSRLAGVVRAGAYALYERPVYPVSGTDQVYGINVARFLADGDAADQLVLSLYGTLGARNDAGHVRLRRGRERRPAPRQPLPLDVPAAERGEQRGVPADAAVAARAREPGRRRARRRASSSRSRRRGRGSARDGGSPSGACRPASGRSRTRSSRAATRSARRVELPARPAPKTLKLRLRLPRGQRVESVTVNGVPLELPEGETLGETLDLSGRTGRLEVAFATAAAGRPRRRA